MPESPPFNYADLVRRMFPGVRAAACLALTETNDDLDAVLASSKDAALSDFAGTQAVRSLARAALDSGRTTWSDDAPMPTCSALVAHPFVGQQRYVLVAALDDGAPQQRDMLENMLGWAGQWLGLSLPASAASTGGPLEAAGAARLLSCATLGELMQRAAQEFASALSCKRALIGLVHGDSVRLAALSDRRQFDARAEPVAALGAVLNEAYDQGESITYPAVPATHEAVAVAHRQLSLSARATLATVPLAHAGQTVAVVTLMRDIDAPFSAEELTTLQAPAAWLGSLIALRRAAEQSAFQRLRTQSKRHWRAFTGPNAARRRVLAACATLVALVTLAGHGDYEVPADAVLAGTSERTLAAPVDGFLADVRARAGSRVQKGDVLAVLDHEPLQRERQRIQGEFAALSSEYNVALARLDGAAAGVKRAQLAQARARLEQIDDQLRRLEVVAPFDALVLDGDLRDATGAPVRKGETLFRLAPEGGFVVRLHVDERDVEALGPGAVGRLKLAALPNTALEVTVTRIDGMAQSRDGRGVLEMEAAVRGEVSYLRPGMKGVARLEAGRARRLWIWTHAVAERLRLWFWRLSPVA